MLRLKLYLDTSVISLLYQDQDADRQTITRDFFKNIIEASVYEVFISSVVISELSRTPNPDRRKKLLDEVARLNLVGV